MPQQTSTFESPFLTHYAGCCRRISQTHAIPFGMTLLLYFSLRQIMTRFPLMIENLFLLLCRHFYFDVWFDSSWAVPFTSLIWSVLVLFSSCFSMCMNIIFCVSCPDTAQTALPTPPRGQPLKPLYPIPYFFFKKIPSLFSMTY